jgi:hypothetical protein
MAQSRSYGTYSESCSSHASSTNSQSASLYNRFQMQLTRRRNYYERSFSILVIAVPWRVRQSGVFVPIEGAEDERDHCQRLAQTHWICHYPAVELGWWM